MSSSSPSPKLAKLAGDLDHLRVRRDRLKHALAAIEARILAASRALADAIRVDWVTVRQQEVLQLVRAGKANKEIAWDLHISERTVKYHVGLLMQRAGVDSRLKL